MQWMFSFWSLFFSMIGFYTEAIHVHLWRQTHNPNPQFLSCSVLAAFPGIVVAAHECTQSWQKKSDRKETKLDHKMSSNRNRKPIFRMQRLVAFLWYNGRWAKMRENLKENIEVTAQHNTHSVSHSEMVQRRTKKRPIRKAHLQEIGQGMPHQKLQKKSCNGIFIFVTTFPFF